MCLVTEFQPLLAVAIDRNYFRVPGCWDKSVSAEKAANAHWPADTMIPPVPGQTPPHLFTEASFQVQGLVGHEEVPGGLCTRLGSQLLWSILHLTDQQTCRVPGKQQTITWWHLVLGRGRNSAFSCPHNPRSHWQGGQSWANNQAASLDHLSPLR